MLQHTCFHADYFDSREQQLTVVLVHACAVAKSKAGSKGGSKKEAAAAAVGLGGAAAGMGAPKLAEDSAHERDDRSENSSVQLEPDQGAAGRPAAGQEAGEPDQVELAAQRMRAEKGKGKVEERRRTDSASSLRCARLGF